MQTGDQDAIKSRTRAWRELYREPDQDGRVSFTTVSGEAIEPLYTPEDIAHINYLSDIGFPGEYPYTRGIHPTMYRGKLWTMRQFAGFGTPEDTNERYHYLLQNGQTGLSVAFDLPTLMGRDADDPVCGRGGRASAASRSARSPTWRPCSRASRSRDVSTSMTINCARPRWCSPFTLRSRRSRARSPRQLRGTIQADILKEYIAQKEWIYPPQPVDAHRHRYGRVSARGRCRSGIRSP